MGGRGAGVWVLGFGKGFELIGLEGLVGFLGVWVRALELVNGLSFRRLPSAV